MKQVRNFSAIRINRQLGRTGALWQRGYFDRAIRTTEPLIGIARYIVLNPVRAGIVPDIRLYPHWDAVWLTPETASRSLPL